MCVRAWLSWGRKGWIGRKVTREVRESRDAQSDREREQGRARPFRIKWMDDFSCGKTKESRHTHKKKGVPERCSSRAGRGQFTAHDTSLENEHALCLSSPPPPSRRSPWPCVSSAWLCLPFLHKFKVHSLSAAAGIKTKDKEKENRSGESPLLTAPSQGVGRAQRKRRRAG